MPLVNLILGLLLHLRTADMYLILLLLLRGKRKTLNAKIRIPEKINLVITSSDGKKIRQDEGI